MWQMIVDRISSFSYECKHKFSETMAVIGLNVLCWISNGKENKISESGRWWLKCILTIAPVQILDFNFVFILGSLLSVNNANFNLLGVFALTCVLVGTQMWKVIPSL